MNESEKLVAKSGQEMFIYEYMVYMTLCKTKFYLYE